MIGENTNRTPALWLSPNDSKPTLNCSVNNNWNHLIPAESSLELSKWYHIAYTLSEPQNRMEVYKNGKLVGYTDVKDIKFNEFPLKIGHSDGYTDFQGQMRISNPISTKVAYLMFSDYLEIFSEPTYFPTNKKTIQHNDLPSVTNELSVTFQLNLEKHDPNWISEDEHHARTPAFWLSPNDSKPHHNCSVNNNWNHNISAGNNLELNKWYHITYTLSVPQKRMELYVDGELVGYTDVKDIIFNEFPLKIGHSGNYTDFQGQMSVESQIFISAKVVYLMFSDYLEIFSEPTYFPTNKKTMQHNELPSVTNELSVAFRLNLERHDSNWITIFIKGEDEQQARTPALFLSPNDSKPLPNCSVNNNWNHNISVGNNIELNKWYHIAYTLSEPQKRMEFYVNGELVGYNDVKDIIFNEFPLKIGYSDKYSDFKGQMRELTIRKQVPNNYFSSK
ncbi:37147_t:CDS:2 [Gigaspora margarita]|uniref:37147_t:CDS:1 n=1 Tax=Gigaspora margarita TaxID=4874 RepID=A0ABM8W1D9_GIGMA|nr:37147_t:CDS:2 [Gigaspora margarita]